jgi:4-amino-4-deoxy-L-arabinose transferase-like glycosyltransferase
MAISSIGIGPLDEARRLTDGQRAMAIILILLFARAVIVFGILPALSQAIGANYQAELFPDRYDMIAENLINGNGYRVYADTSETMLRSPGFILILAAIFALFGKTLLAVQIVQFLMSAATAAMIYLMSQRLLSYPRVSLVAAALVLVHPVLMMSDTRGGTDTTLAFCLTATLWLLFRAIDSRRGVDFGLTGVVLGYTMLVKASVALIVPAIFLLLASSTTFGAQLRTLIRNFAITSVLAAFVMAPWVIRNFELSGEFVPTMTAGPMAMFQGEEGARIGFAGKDSWVVFEAVSDEQIRIGHEMGLHMRDDFFPQFYKVGDELAFYNELGHRAWAEYQAHPSLMASALAHNSWAFWFQGRTQKATLINFIIVLPFLLLSVYGAILCISRNRVSWLIVISVAAFILPHLVILTVARYVTAVIPIMSILAAGSLFAFSDRRLAVDKPA